MAMWRIIESLTRIVDWVSVAADQIFGILDQTNLYGETIGEVLFGALLPLFLLRLAGNIFGKSS